MSKKPTMRRIFNLIQIALLLVALFLTLTSNYGHFQQYYYVRTGTGNSVSDFSHNELYYKNHEEPVSEGIITFSTLQEGNPVWSYMTLGSIGLCILISLASIIRKSNDRDGFLHLFLPFLTIWIFYCFGKLFWEASSNLRSSLFTIYSDEGSGSSMILILLGAVFFLAFVKRSKLFNHKDSVKVYFSEEDIVPISRPAAPVSTPAAPTASTAPAAPRNIPEEIKQYKELLDSGILTQEEFDAKKKQLLGL